MHDFQTDFYGYEMRAIVLGYIRPELDYVSRGTLAFSNLFGDVCLIPIAEALIQDIEIDKQVALNCLQRPEYQKYATDAHFDRHSESDVKANM